MKSTVEKTTIELNTEERKLLIQVLGEYCNEVDHNIPHSSEMVTIREMYDTFKND